MPRTSSRFIVVLGIAVLSTLPSALPLRAQAGGSVSKGQVSEEDHKAHHPEGQGTNTAPQTQGAPAPADAGMKGMQGKMQGMRTKMMADMKAQDARIAALVARMNSATGAAKTDAMAELLTALVQQHKSMRDNMDAMMQMHDSMMMQMMPPSGRGK